MTAPPARNTLSGTPTNAQFNAGIGALYDYTVGLLGAAGTPAAARAALDAVGLTGNETIAGVKTFSSAPVVPDDAFTFAKLQNIATGTILGRSTAGTGDVEALTGAQATNIITGAVGQLAGFRNLLINGNFQINQRGYVSGTNVGAANTYTLDRWRVVTSGQNVTFTASGNGNQITAPAGGIEQVIEGINIGGGTYVLNWTGTATATVNGTARAKGESFTLPANTNATVRLIGGTASQVQLEPGSVNTPFEHRLIGAELALCQRYYFRWDAGSGANIHGLSYPLSTLTIGELSFPVPMRATPTITAGVGGGSVTSTAPSTTGVVFAGPSTGFFLNGLDAAIEL